MARSSSNVDRQVKIELLRARAALEREALAQDIASASHDLKPGNVVRQWIPGGIQSSLPRLLWKGVTLARRYPVVSSALSAIVMKRRGKGASLLKLAGSALVGWQAFKVWRSTRDSASDSEHGQSDTHWLDTDQDSGL